MRMMKPVIVMNIIGKKDSSHKPEVVSNVEVQSGHIKKQEEKKSKRMTEIKSSNETPESNTNKEKYEETQVRKVMDALKVQEGTKDTIKTRTQSNDSNSPDKPTSIRQLTEDERTSPEPQLPNEQLNEDIQEEQKKHYYSRSPEYRRYNKYYKRSTMKYVYKPVYYKKSTVEPSTELVNPQSSNDKDLPKENTDIENKEVIKPLESIDESHDDIAIFLKNEELKDELLMEGKTEDIKDELKSEEDMIIEEDDEPDYFSCFNPLSDFGLKLPTPFSIKKDKKEENKQSDITLYEAYKSANVLLGDRTLVTEKESETTTKDIGPPLSD